MSDEVFKFTGKKKILTASRGPRTPLKDLLNLPKRLKDKIVNKSKSLWKYPIRNDRKRKFNDENKENEGTSRNKRRRHLSTTPAVEHKEIKMAVIHINYPESELSQDQADLVRRYVINALIKAAPRSWGSDLDIIVSKYEEGIFWVTCGNQRTVNWLWETVHSLGDSADQVLLRVVESKFVPNIVQKVYVQI